MRGYGVAELSMDVPAFLRNGKILIAIFAVLATVSGAGVILAIGGGTEELLIGLGVGVVAAAATVGTYLFSIRSGHPHSHAVAWSGIIFGTVLTIAVVAELLRSSGELAEFEIAAGLVGGVVVTLALIGIIGVVDRYTSPA